jgi:hypothetical protein
MSFMAGNSRRARYTDPSRPEFSELSVHTNQKCAHPAVFCRLFHRPNQQKMDSRDYRNYHPDDVDKKAAPSNQLPQERASRVILLFDLVHGDPPRSDWQIVGCGRDGVYWKRS